MIEKYYTYIKEHKESLYVDINDIVSKTTFLKEVEDKLDKLVHGKVCIWYTKGNSTLKKQIVTDVKVRRQIGGKLYIYFNDFGVDTTYKVEIEGGKLDTNEEKIEIIGNPSGEVLYVDKLMFMKLSSMGHVKYNKSKNFYYFEDSEYYDIMKIINPSYEKPKKKNIEEKKKYDEGDVIICQGKSGMLNLTDKIGKIIQVRDNSQIIGTNYLVSFILNFSKYLMSGNRWWVKKENIKGIYTGDLELQRTLSDLQQRDRNMEEHEVDDDYHIRQLFKKEKEFEVGGKSVKIHKNPKNRPDVNDWVIIENVPGIHLINDRSFEDDKFAVLMSGGKKTWFKFDAVLASSKDKKDIENIRKHLENTTSEIKVGDKVFLHNNKNCCIWEMELKWGMPLVVKDAGLQINHYMGEVTEIKYFDDIKFCKTYSSSSYWYKESCLKKVLNND